MNLFEHEYVENSDIIVLGVPYDGATSNRPGARFGPQAILEDSHHQEWYSPYTGLDFSDDSQKSFQYVPYINLKHNVNDMIFELYNYFFNEIKNKIPVMLGGDHSLTYAPVKALHSKYPNLKVLQLDAHTDLRDTFNDSENSHACVMNNIAKLIGINNIKQFGIRSGTREEFRKMYNYQTILTEISNTSTCDNTYTLENFFEQCRDENSPLYITIDIDVFDIAGTGTPVPGGIHFQEFIKIIKLLHRYQINIVGFDIMELAPHYDHSGFSTTTATLCLKELLLLLRDK